MFSSLGLFRDVKCPQADCNLPNCFFNHDDSRNSIGQEVVYDLLSPNTVPSPPTKRRRIEDPKTSTNHTATIDTETPAANNSVMRKEMRKPEAEALVSIISKDKRPASVISKPAQSQPVSITRPISPPPVKSRLLNVSQTKAVAPNKIESLVPRALQRDPVPFPQRVKILQKLHEQICGLNSKLRKSGVSDSKSNLGEQELIKVALGEEQKAAMLYPTPDGYKNALAQRLSFFRKMDCKGWATFVVSERQKHEAKDPSETNQRSITSLSEDQEQAVICFMQTSLVGLEGFGYVTAPPTSRDIEDSRKAHAAAAGWEVCDRCGGRFQVFPGRNEEGALTSRGRCTYHWAKAQRRKDINEATYPCCGQSAGSEGCETCASHVFKINDPKRLASILQFKLTPPNSAKSLPVAVTFDCEMGYTTFGMELIRLTAITWPDKRDLLDVLVRPYGEILDFNTRFSGVDAEQYARALPYLTNNEGDAPKPGDRRTAAEPLRKVDSAAEARTLLFDLISPETPLIGHAIENDLNTCRIIHPTVIDTVLLFPHPRGLPVRYRLRDLSAKYLQRQIQTAGASGHDSKEDSKATGDLVRVKAAEKFKTLTQSEYLWKDGQLLPTAHI